MENSVFQKIKDLLMQHEEMGIAVGRNPTLDEMAGALSLYLALTDINKKVSIACPTEPIVEISSLVGINKVKDNFEVSGGDLVVSFPYNEGEIEKVSYTLENGFLNIIVKAGEQGLTFNEKEVNYKRGGGGSPSLLLVIGTPRLSSLGNLFNPEALKDSTLINIDNKTDNQGFGDVVYVSPKFSSVSEQIANLILSLDLKINQDIAQNLLSGISFATDNFQNPSTSALAFEMASVLMRNGAMREKKRQPELKSEKLEEDNQFFKRKNEEQKDQRGVKTPPSDWLKPRIYKGSTSI